MIRAVTDGKSTDLAGLKLSAAGIAAAMTAAHVVESEDETLGCSEAVG